MTPSAGCVPLTDRDAKDMLEDVRGVRRLRGYRGSAVADERALEDALVRVSAFLDACPEIQEIDVNPLSVMTKGVIALDARIRLAEPQSQRPTRRVRY